jgi:hypothetical protein
VAPARKKRRQANPARRETHDRALDIKERAQAVPDFVQTEVDAAGRFLHRQGRFEAPRLFAHVQRYAFIS